MMIREITVKWCIDDVLNECPELSEEQASAVLVRLKENHDSCVGINWEVINETASTMYPELV